jgi:hypothetical protein
LLSHSTSSVPQAAPISEAIRKIGPNQRPIRASSLP